MKQTSSKAYFSSLVRWLPISATTRSIISSAAFCGSTSANRNQNHRLLVKQSDINLLEINVDRLVASENGTCLVDRVESI